MHWPHLRTSMKEKSLRVLTNLSPISVYVCQRNDSVTLHEHLCNFSHQGPFLGTVSFVCTKPYKIILGRQVQSRQTRLHLALAVLLQAQGMTQKRGAVSLMFILKMSPMLSLCQFSWHGDTGKDFYIKGKTSSCRKTFLWDSQVKKEKVILGLDHEIHQLGFNQPRCKKMVTVPLCILFLVQLGRRVWALLSGPQGLLLALYWWITLGRTWDHEELPNEHRSVT